jgi:hypothetical protein
LRLKGDEALSLRPAQLDKLESSRVARPEKSRGRRKQAMGNPTEAATASVLLVAIAESFEQSPAPTGDPSPKPMLHVKFGKKRWFVPLPKGEKND